MKHPIGVFDSGYGGLTILKDIVKIMPEYDYLYLGDNARTPYGTRSFDMIYQYTLECVQFLFDRGCPLVILACNTASARALRTIQQEDLPLIAPNKRVLGVIRPTAEVIGQFSVTREIGILGTPGTVASQSYLLEINKFYPDLKVYQQACPMWVPLVENGEIANQGTVFFVEKYVSNLLSIDQNIDTLLLACTHYPLLLSVLKKVVPPHIQFLTQGKIIGKSLKDYLHRHPEMEERLSSSGKRYFCTSDDKEIFEQRATFFYGRPIGEEVESVVF